MGKRSTKNSLYEVGKSYFYFDKNEEIKIYEFVCRSANVKEKEVSDEQKFYRYAEWEKHVIDKCSKYPDDKLVEFKHHLIQWRRLIRPTRESKNQIWSIVATWALTELVEIVIVASELNDKFKSAVSLVFAIVIISLVDIVLFVGVCKFIGGWFKDNSEENFFDDYIAVVEKMLEKREKEC